VRYVESLPDGEEDERRAGPRAPLEHLLLRRTCCLATSLLCMCVLLSCWGVGGRHQGDCGTVAQWNTAAVASNATLSVCASLRPRFPADVLRVNDVQTVGTHNSYHVAPILAFSTQWRYTHLPIQEQLDAGVRSLEFDPHWDPVYSSFNVYHEPVVDYRSRCHCLTSCMREVADWSSRNPGHAILKLVIEPKYNIDVINPYRGKRGVARMRALQDTLVAHLPADKVLTPALVQGDAPTMRDAIRPGSCGWPSDEETRGMLMFILDAWMENAHAGVALRALPLSEQLLFNRGTAAYSIPDDVAVLELSACECSKTQLNVDGCLSDTRALVAQNYIVRAALNTAGCALRNVSALAQGAVGAGVQILSTDYIAEALPLPCGRNVCCRPGIQAPCTAESAGDPTGTL
jgi:hypothetical protein